MTDLPPARSSPSSSVGPLPAQVSAFVDKKDYTTSPAVPLRQWAINHQKMPPDLMLQRDAILAKITVAYAIGKLLEHLRIIVSGYSKDQIESLCSVDNFVVCMSEHGTSHDGWEVMSITMISPPLTLKLVSTSFTRSNFFESANDEDCGRTVEAVIATHSLSCCSKTAFKDETLDDKFLCYSFGVLLDFIFFGGSLLDVTMKPGPHENEKEDEEPSDVILEESRPAKFACIPSRCEDSFSGALSLSSPDAGNHNGSDAISVKASLHTHPSFASLPAISRLVVDLLNCECEIDPFGSDDSYSSFEEAIHDLHLLLQDPKSYLFERINPRPQNEMLTFANDKMYGRTSEVSALTDAFCKVALSGTSEAFLIGGFSGCGKTRLVQSVFHSVFSAGGMVVNGKFDQTSSCPLNAVLSAFDDLCILIADRNSEEYSRKVYQLLVAEFGTSFHLLVHVLPNVLRLSSSPSTALSLDGDVLNEGEVNFYSLCDIIKRFMRVVSSASCPVMLFLDDLQWADPISLGVVHTVLSDLKGANCMFFVGSYRDNEVKPSHIIFGFCDQLSAFEVPITTIHLDGMPEDDVNLMISGAFGIFPRLCRSLSQIVFRKTGGNPFFVKTFLRSLADKGLLKYSLRSRSWVWSDNKINAESVTPNVLDLVTAKMTTLSQNVQSALQVAACFGIKIKCSIVQDLSKSPQHSSLLSDINEAVQDGFMDLDADGSHYRFVHDKVREAAYGMIRCECKNRYHFDVGMTLLSSCEGQIHEKSDTLFTIIDQINHGVPSLVCCESQRISIAKLNYEACSKAMQSFNYTSAYTHSKAAISLLPDDSWKTQYDLNLIVHFLFAKAAHPCKKVVEARDSLNKILYHADCIGTKLDAYTILESILLSASAFKEMQQLFTTIRGALNSLGENIPDEHTASQELTNEVNSAKKCFEMESDDSLLNIHKSGSKKDCFIIHAYNILVRLAWNAKLKSYNYFVARWVRFCLKSKAASKYVPVAYATFASVLCEDRNIQNLQLGYRIGKLSLKMIDHNNSATSELPLVYLLHYGHIAIMFEPIQACIDMHRRACKIGLQCGKAFLAALHKQFLIVREMLVGTNLLAIKEEIEFELKMTSHHSFPILGKLLPIHYTTVMTLIGDKSEGFSHHPDDMCSDVQLFENDSAYLFSQMFVSTHLGFFERAKRLGERWEVLCKSRTMLSNLRASVISFYYALALIAWQRKNKWKNVPNNINSLLEVVVNAAKCSAWNFNNKVSLLKAELYSFRCKNSEAEVEYDVAIKLARASRFVHEEALAYELAGKHYERLNNTEKALARFQQARRCYKNWGSQRKSNQLAEKIDKLQC
eukprot:CCRYP_000531-RA/>CCRYP_000531-RA protein AED:0.03 eAED:0.03 QI:150/1/1/1/1/1/4/75/1330